MSFRFMPSTLGLSLVLLFGEMMITQGAAEDRIHPLHFSQAQIVSHYGTIGKIEIPPEAVDEIVRCFPELGSGNQGKEAWDISKGWFTVRFMTIDCEWHEVLVNSACTHYSSPDNDVNEVIYDLLHKNKDCKGWPLTDGARQILMMHKPDLRPKRPNVVPQFQSISDRIELNKPKKLDFSASLGDVPDAVKIQSVTVHEKGRWVEIKMAIRSEPENAWLLNLALLDNDGVETETIGRFIEGLDLSSAVDGKIEHVVGLNLSEFFDLSKLERFQIKLRPLYSKKVEPRKNIWHMPLQKNKRFLLPWPWLYGDHKQTWLTDICFYEIEGRLRAKMGWDFLFLFYGSRKVYLVLADDSGRTIKKVSRISEDFEVMLGELDEASRGLSSMETFYEIDFGSIEDLIDAKWFYLDAVRLPQPTAKVPIEFDTTIPLDLACGAEKETEVALFESLVLRKVDDRIRADIRTRLEPQPEGKWKIDLFLYGRGGRVLEIGGIAVLDNGSKETEGVIQIDLMSLGRWQEILDENEDFKSDIRLHVRVRQVSTDTLVTSELLSSAP